MTDSELNALTNRELSVIVGEKVMGWEPGTLDEYRRQVSEWGEGKTAFDWVDLVTYLPDYANDIAAAMLILDHFRGKGFGFRLQLSQDCKQWEVHNHDDGIYLAGWSWVKGHDYINVDADTLPRAICLAALEAVGFDVE